MSLVLLWVCCCCFLTTAIESLGFLLARLSAVAPIPTVVGDSAIAVTPALAGVPKIKHLRLVKYPATTVELVFLLLDHPTFYYQTKEANYVRLSIIGTSKDFSVSRP
jgi:hypothetical protein